jgi:hypothetical protein
MSLAKIPLTLVACILAACLSNLLWIELNVAPPRMWDDAEYLADSVTTYHALERRDWTGFLRAASQPARGVHPPMTKLVPIPMYVLFGPGTSSALYAYTALIPVFCVYVFLLGRLITRSTRTAVLAVVVTCCFPLTYGLWRHVMAEFGLAVATVAAQYHLGSCAERRLGSVSHGVLAGAFIGWGLLWKVSLPVFVVGPVCYLLVRNADIRNAPARRLRTRVLAAIAAAALIVAGPFYWLRSRALWEFTVYNTTPSTSLEQFSLGPVFSPVTVLKYWATLINIGVSSYWFILFALLVTVHLLRRRGALPHSMRWFVASCGLLPLIVFSLQYLKEPRHLFPAFAMFGILIAALMQASLAGTSARTRAAVLAATLSFPVYQFAYLSFAGVWRPSADMRMGPFVLLFADPEVPRVGSLPSYAYPANSTAWPVDRVVDLMAAHGSGERSRAHRVRVVGHIAFLDGPVLDYESQLRHRMPVVYSMLGNRSLSPTWWDFLVVLSGPLRQRFEYREPVLERLLGDQRLPFIRVASVALPEGRKALLYRRAVFAGTFRIEENLITATGRSGGDLFAVPKAEWDLPGGRGSVAVSRDGVPIELPYVYVPDAVDKLSWQVVRDRRRVCERADVRYRVVVADMHSARGPARELSTRFGLAAPEQWATDSVDMGAFREDIVTVRLSAESTADAPGSCVGWSDLRLVSGGVAPISRP